MVMVSGVCVCVCVCAVKEEKNWRRRPKEREVNPRLGLGPRIAAQVEQPGVDTWPIVRTRSVEAHRHEKSEQLTAWDGVQRGLATRFPTWTCNEISSVEGRGAPVREPL